MHLHKFDQNFTTTHIDKLTISSISSRDNKNILRKAQIIIQDSTCSTHHPSDCCPNFIYCSSCIIHRVTGIEKKCTKFWSNFTWKKTNYIIKLANPIIISGKWYRKRHWLEMKCDTMIELMRIMSIMYMISTGQEPALYTKASKTRWEFIYRLFITCQQHNYHISNLHFKNKKLLANDL